MSLFSPWRLSPVVWLVSLLRSACAGSAFIPRAHQLSLYLLGLMLLLGATVRADTITMTGSTLEEEDIGGQASPRAATPSTRASKPARITRTQGGTSGLVISEFRAHGPLGATDEYVELFNSTNAPLSIGGWSLRYTSGGVATTTTFPASVVVPAYGHYLIVGAGYNSALASYATGDLELPSNLDIAAGSTIAVYDGDNSLVDDTSGVTTPSAGTLGEFAFVRSTSGSSFDFVSTDGNASNAAAQLGAPGPQNLSSPIATSGVISYNLVYPGAAEGSAPNRSRSTSAANKTLVTNATGEATNFGTMQLRRAITNNSTRDIIGFRVRVIDIASLNSPGYSNSAQADLRLMSSSDQNILFVVGGQPQLVRGTTVQMPPNQPKGAALNSSATMPSVTLAQPLAAGQTANYNFLYGVIRDGSFNITFHFEAIFAPGPEPTATPEPTPTATPEPTPTAIPTSTPTPTPLGMDASIRKDTMTTNWSGAGVVNTTASGQTIEQNAVAEETVSYYVLVKRPVVGPDRSVTIRVADYADFTATQWKAQFFVGVGVNTRNVTAEVTSAQGWTTEVNSEGELLLRVAISVPGVALADQSQTLLIHATRDDGAGDVLRDVVGAKTTVHIVSPETPVTVQRIEWSFDGEHWATVGGPIPILRGQSVGLRAVVRKIDDHPWHSSQQYVPAWLFQPTAEFHIGEMVWVPATLLGTISFSVASFRILHGTLQVSPDPDDPEEEEENEP